MSRRAAIAGATGLLSAAAVAVAGFAALGPDRSTQAADALELPTVRVDDRDLVLDHEAVGELSPVTEIEVTSPVEGTVVEVAEPGSVVGAGSVLAVVDDRPVVVLDGVTPSWRDLSVGDEGPDVAQLEAALVSAGFDPDGSVTVDDEYTSATAAMVEDWQESVGAEPTGEVVSGTVVFLSEPMRVESVVAGAGSPVGPGDTVVRLASLDRVAVADVPVADAVGLAPGDAVTVRLPDRTTIDGTVASVVAPADTSVRQVTVDLATPDDPDVLAGLGSVDVDVLWQETVAEDVPTLPATAFRRLDDGRYVVDVVQGGEPATVTVEPGRQAGNRVEVAGVPRDADVVAP